MSTDSESASGTTVSFDDLDSFRRRVRDVLAIRFSLRDPMADDERKDIIARTHDHDGDIDRARELQRFLFEAGLAGLNVPVEYGGRGMPRAFARVVEEELGNFDAPPLQPLGIGMSLGLHTLLASGSEDQKSGHIPRIISGDEQWCQLFSEPDAGSDLVSLRTKAVLDGDEWVVTGQKVWSSFAASAHFGLLLARTDPDSPKPHVGITMFILPMDLPGVTVRPLVDIAGGRHFNEVFIEEARLPQSAVIGEVNKGWGVSQGTLGGERSGYMGGSGGGRRRLQLMRAAERAGRLQEPSVRQRMVSLIAEERILEWVRDRYQAGSLAGGHPGAGVMMKLAAGTLEQRCAELICDISGPHGVAWDNGDHDGDVVSHALNASRQATIAGGTHQIQRNLLGERVLGLPR